MQHFWADSEYLGKINTKKKFKIFFQCLALPKDPQSFGSQNLCCPFSVSQYYTDVGDCVDVEFGKHFLQKWLLNHLTAKQATAQVQRAYCLNSI